MGELEVDWASGLPDDVLALVAKAGGVPDMKGMREVCKTWQSGFELSVQGIKFPHRAPVQLGGAIKTANRFPGLISLDLGESSLTSKWMWSLHTIPKLRVLVMGSTSDEWRLKRKPKHLCKRLTNEELWFLRGLPLTSLNLAFCFRLTSEGLESLRGMPLTSLDLSATRTGLEFLKGMPLTELSLRRKSCGSGLGYLHGVPLTRLDLSRCPLSEADLAPLRGLPIATLALSYCLWLRRGATDVLLGLPLTRLCLVGCIVEVENSYLERKGPGTCLVIRGEGEMPFAEHGEAGNLVMVWLDAVAEVQISQM